MGKDLYVFLVVISCNNGDFYFILKYLDVMIGDIVVQFVVLKL